MKRTGPRHRSRENTALVSGGPSDWLLGTWKSDKAATIAHWKKNPPGSKKFQEVLLKHLGKLIKRFTARRMYTLFEESSSQASYKPIWQNKDSLVLVYGSRKDEQAMLLTFITPEQYWIQAGSYVEYFTKQRDA